ncbi:MAG: N-acetylneuraminate synthase family protein [Treponema sp.]|jgi:sialic acid synthase SpsE|nr:N-acetylneuraminate synthase family protein [Treponema sp.]
MEKVTNKAFAVNDTAYDAQNPLIIAELGTSHGADPAKARDLVDAAAKAGANCVKFQMVYAHEILHPKTGAVKLPGGMIPLYDTFKKLESAVQFFADIKDYAEKRGLIFLCTPFGPRSASEIAALNPLLFKIASPELNYTSLLKQVAGFQLPVLLSSGVSRLGDIEEALELFKPPGGRDNPERICLLHCVTSYPAPETDYNLRVLRSLSAIFGTPVGVSDHSADPELVPVLAAAMGAAVIEKHFCLSRQDPGLDDPIALPPEDFARMTAALRRTGGLGAEAMVEALARERGPALVEAVLGSGVKALAPSEKANYLRTNRSIHALRDIEAGEVITADMTGILRTEKILRPGLPPSWAEKIAGRRARQVIPAGEGIRFEDI